MLNKIHFFLGGLCSIYNQLSIKLRKTKWNDRMFQQFLFEEKNAFQWEKQHNTYERIDICERGKSLQLCSTLCHPIDCNPKGSCVHGLLQVRILEWVAMPSSRASSRSRDWTRVSRIVSELLIVWATRGVRVGEGIPTLQVFSSSGEAVAGHHSRSNIKAFVAQWALDPRQGYLSVLEWPASSVLPWPKEWAAASAAPGLRPSRHAPGGRGPVTSPVCRHRCASSFQALL